MARQERNQRSQAATRRAVLRLGVLAVVLAAGRASGQETAKASPPEGVDLFRHYCGACHGTDGTGHGPVASSLKHAVPDLTQLAKRNHGSFPEQYVKQTIEGTETGAKAHGTREMPVWGPVFHQIEWDRDLGNVKLDALTRYLASIQKK